LLREIHPTLFCNGRFLNRDITEVDIYVAAIVYFWRKYLDFRGILYAEDLQDYPPDRQSDEMN
jgi:hypothetical protein